MGSDSDQHISRFVRFVADAALVDRFERREIIDNSRIVSRCKECGTIVVGSGNLGLAAKERAHAPICTERQRTATLRTASRFDP
jgi:hypothetical protein